MKNFLMFTAAMAAMCMVSCSNDEYTEVAESKAISFENAFVDKSTRAELDAFTLSKFTVNGYQGENLLFDGQEVEKNTDGNWTYSPVKYWVADASYSFMAVADATVKEKSLSGGTLTTKIEFTNDGETDVLASAQVNQTGATEDAVAFTFKHLLSKVKFTFDNGFASDDDVTLQVKGVKITNAYTTATATVSGTTPDISWDATGDAAQLELAFGDTEEIAPAANDEAANTLYLIPSSGKDYTVTFDIDVIANADNDNKFVSQTYSHTVTVSNVEFKPGYSYNLTASLNASNVGGENETLLPINFSVNGVAQWADATSAIVE